MPEVPEEHDADSEQVGPTPARSEAPAWVGKTPRAHIVTERYGLIGWTTQWTVWTKRAPADPIRGLGRPVVYDSFLASKSFRLSPAACQVLSGDGHAGYPDLFQGAVVHLKVGLGMQGTHQMPHVVWGSFNYLKTREPVIDDLVIATTIVGPGTLTKVLADARKHIAEQGDTHGN